MSTATETATPQKKNLKISTKIYKGRANTPAIAICIWAFLLMIISYGIYMYVDITNTMSHSVLLWRCLTEGRILEFYEYTLEYTPTDYAANYSFFSYIIWAIWNLPSFIAYKVAGVDYMNSVACLMWCKGLLVVATIAVMVMMYKILDLIIKNEADSAITAESINDIQTEAAIGTFVMFFSSVALMLGTFMLTQIDMVAIFLMLLGIYFILSDNEKMFIIVFAIAIPCKFFALFLFIPILLLREKNVLKIIGKTLCVLILPIIETLIFGGSDIYQSALGSQNRDALAQLLAPNFESGTCVFLLIYVWVIIYCYLKEDEKEREVIYICFLVFGSFVTFVQITTYWIVLMLPFLAILTGLNKKARPLYLLLEGAASFGFFMEEAITGAPLNEDIYIVNRLLFKPISGTGEIRYKYENTLDMLAKFGIDDYYEAFFSLFMACMIVLLVITSPKIAKKLEDKLQFKDKTAYIATLIFRGVVLAIALFIPLYAYGATTKAPVYENVYYDGLSVASVSLTDGEDHVVEQTIRLPYDGIANYLKLKFYNESSARNNFASVTVGFYDGDTDECLAEKTIGCSMIESEADITIDLPGIELISGKEYVIRITGKQGTQYAVSKGSNPWISPFLIPTSLIGELYVDGEEQDGELYFAIGE
ncbi:MAG: hypothetical protein K6A23_12670 [Butyrivibrio sp.]|nr:hypothetical protein [Butyrivibrio sp.]